MTRARQVSEMFRAALRHDARDRAAFLDVACDGDTTLSDEVHALLAGEGSAGTLPEPQPPGSVVSVFADVLRPSLIGRQLGSYQIVSLIGAGGMGEVYRARDLKLGRDVAIKVLPPSFAHDPQRLRRFEREARLLAALNHPHIATIYGFQDESGVQALILELIDGATLGEWLRSRSVPVSEALSVARQIAEALGAAHEKGIVHRDLKPANITITRDGTVKVLDFGLATEWAAGDAADPDPWPLTAIAASATLTAVGVVLGTPAYMSPEQAQGHAADKRSDVWAFGCVLYEMLAGRRAFNGALEASALDPDWTALPANVPQPVRTLLESCLFKDPRRRVADMSTALFVLDNAESLAAPMDLPPTRSITQRWGALAVVTAGVLALAGVPVWLGTRTAAPTQAIVRFQVPAPGALPVEMFAVSADGRSLAFIADNGGAEQLWIRSLDTLEPRVLAGTEDAAYPFWSPDGAYVGFFAQGKLKKIAIEGGPPQNVSDATNARGGTWNRDGVILFSAGPTSPILRVPAAGGLPSPVTRVSDSDSGAGHRFPAFLPDGIHFLFHAGSDNAEAAGVHLGSLDGSPGVRLLPDETNALYAPPSSPGGRGHLVFRRDDILMAQPFDVETLKLSGEMLPMAENVPDTERDGFGAFSVSSTGTLAYRTRDSASSRQLVWTDRTGRRVAVMASGRVMGTPAISSDRGTVALTMITGVRSDVWLQDLGRDVLSRLTFRPGNSRQPVWAPDGTRLAFAFQAAGAYSTDIYVKPSSGGGREEFLFHGGVNGYPLDWSSDNRWIVYQRQIETTGLDLWLAPLEGERKPIPYLETPFNESNARFVKGSKEGPQWMAYQSDESGRMQIYVQSIPAGMKYQISTSGGWHPEWRGDGKELFYFVPGSKVMAVDVAPGPGLTFGTPHELFATAGGTGYDAAADGQRFLVNVPADEAGATASPVTVVLGWTAGLKK